MIPIEDLADVTLAIEDTDEDEEDNEDEEVKGEEEDEQNEGNEGGQAGLLWPQCANIQSLLEERKINGARRISG